MASEPKQFSAASGLLAIFPAVIGAVLVWLGYAHLTNGVAVDGAIPVPNYMLQGITLPKAQYQHGLDSLSKADPADGEAMIAAAEMAMRAGEPPESQTRRLEQALTHAPMSARGWLLLAHARRADDKKGCVAALNQSLLLSQFDYWIAGWRTQLAADLLYDLDQETHQMALRQTRLLWEEPMLHTQLMTALRAPGGDRLVRNAFAFYPEQLTKLSRWAAQRRDRPGPP